MYRKLMWCYVFVLTLLDLSLNSKLTAQGKSHGVTVHDSLVEGITFQEWGSESGAGAGSGSGAGSGRALPPAALRATPPALALGRAPLGAAHAATVTLTNTANTTMHLASIAGTTPDFHASFFDSKTLACGANTSFSVVFLGRREGPVAQHLYIHTSLGVLKYPVSAVGVPSEWALWPLVGVQVPHNATLHTLLHMHNPTDQPVQVMEMYSSASWLGLQLPEGGSSAPRAHWQLPPHSTRALVRLQVRLSLTDTDTRTAYIRIKANVTGAPLVVVVEAAAAAAGAYAEPLQLRAGTRGHRDSPHTFSISLGNSLGSGLATAGGAAGSCSGAPHAPAPPPRPPAPPAPAAPSAPHASLLANGAHTHNGVGGSGAAAGVLVSPLRAHLPPHSAPQPAAHATLDFGKLWAEGTETAEVEAEAEAEEERWCAGWVALAGAALPYSVRLLPGTLTLPTDLHFVTADESSTRAQDIRARNDFRQPLLIVAVEFPPELTQHFHTESWAGLSLAAGAEALVARLTLRRRDPAAVLDTRIAVRTNLTHTTYTVPVKLYSGHLHIEWQWPGADATLLPLGALATSSTRRVLARVHNPAPAPVCAVAHAALPGATLALAAEGGCVPAGGAAEGALVVVAPARAGAVRGAVWLQAPHARARTAVTLHAHPGAVRARLVHRRTDDPEDFAAAPWASGWAPALVVESTMALRMKLTLVEPQPPDPALVFVPPEDPAEWWIGPGTSTLGHVQYLPERACGAACYTGLHVDPAQWPDTALEADLQLLARRRALYDTERLRAVRNVSLAIDTSEMVRIPVSGWVRVGWPRLVVGGGGGGGGGASAGWAGLAGVGAGAGVWLRVRNPGAHALALHAAVGAAADLPSGVLVECEECARETCKYVAGVFGVSEWRAVRGVTAPLRDGDVTAAAAAGAPALLLGPKAEVELKIDFLPSQPDMYTAVLFLRNNLTIVEAVQLGGRGAVPSFELGGRRAHAHAPILLQVPDCSEPEECSVGAGAEESRWEVRRVVTARNTGAVPLRLRAWRLAAEPCAARGFRLEPCAPLTLQPNETRALTLTFTADCSLARVPCPLTLRSDAGPAAFRLLGAVPARLLPLCARQQRRPDWEPALRKCGALLAVVALALVLAAAALDAERLLRRARDARQTPVPRAPLDLRALARDTPAVPPPPAAPRRRKPRRTQPPLDPAAERRAFEHWRAEILRRDTRAEDESSRSSEDADAPAAAGGGGEPAEPQPPSEPPPDLSDTEPDTEEQPRTSGDSDAASTGTDSSSPPEDADEPARAEPAAPSAPPPPPPPPARSSPPPPPEPRSAPRARREPGGAGSPTRRAEPPPRPRAVPGKHHTRKDKVSKRRGERVVAAARVSPPQCEARAAPAAAGAGTGAGTGAAPALRWGASWSSVVAAGAPPPPPPPAPSSEARRSPPQPRAEAARPADHSLFYYNDAHSLRAPQPQPQPPPPPSRPDADFAWRPQERSPFETVAPREYLVADEPHPLPGGSNAYGTIGSPWSSPLWAAGSALRPPPGFAPRAPPPRAPLPRAPPPCSPPPCSPPPCSPPAAVPAVPAAAAPPPVRAFDPFHSLASIWAPAAFDWRADPQQRKQN